MDSLRELDESKLNSSNSIHWIEFGFQFTELNRCELIENSNWIARIERIWMDPMNWKTNSANWNFNSANWNFNSANRISIQRIEFQLSCSQQDSPRCHQGRFPSRQSSPQSHHLCCGLDHSETPKLLWFRNEISVKNKNSATWHKNSAT